MKVFAALFLALFLALAGSVSAQTSEFNEAKGSGTGEIGTFSSWKFVDGTWTYEIDDRGRGFRTHSKKHTLTFNLPMSANDRIDTRVFWAKQGSDLIVLYEVNDGGNGAGTIVRLSGLTLKPKWEANIPSFNVTAGLIEGDHAYLAGMGFAGKLDLADGKYLWRHDDFYRTYKKDGAFNTFETPEIDGSTVVYTEEIEGKQPNLIVIDKTTGKVIRTVLN